MKAAEVAGRGSREKRTRLGFIGAGCWATTNHMPLLKARRDVEMVSVCGLDQKVLRRCQRDFGFQHLTSDYRDLLRQNLDGVVIASPHSLHAEHAFAALRAGCHVMVEKPLATSAVDARRIVELSRDRQRHVVVPYGWHYRPIGMRAREIMKKGVLGKVEFVLCHMASQLRNLFTGKSFDFKDDAYVEPNLSTWADPLISQGGYGQGQLSHATGLMLWLTGLRAESVFANMTKAGARVDLYDAISVRFIGGAIANISGAATLPFAAPNPFQLDIRIFGEKGVLVVDIASDHVAYYTHSGAKKVVSLKSGDGAYQCDGPPRQFVELIRGVAKRNDSPGEVAMRSVEILDAAYRSARTGRVVSVKALNK